MAELMMRATAIRSGVSLEVLTIGWMLAEAVVAIAAGIAAGSVLLIAFGADSVIELLSGAALLWRLHRESRGESPASVETAEHQAVRVSAVLLVLPRSCCSAGWCRRRGKRSRPLASVLEPRFASKSPPGASRSRKRTSNAVRGPEGP
jgi:hypothetical protein